nr:helicase-exonuclease AddAB subunit AddA [Clostridiales bacterium]
MWTREQEQAISSRNGTVLVSAAAGSGKTAVLVERVIARLTDSENECAADSLLIVTFTNAATAQMRERISNALAEKIRLEPDNRYLLRQQMLLPFAKICTIDSFCGELVRENFHKLSIDPDYKILDSGEKAIMKEEAAADTLEALYEENSPEFTDLVELFFVGRDDRELVETIFKLSDWADAYPFPDEWLSGLSKPFCETCADAKETVWGKVIVSCVREAVEHCKETTSELIERAALDEAVQKAYGPALNDDISLYDGLLKALDEKTWDGIRDAFMSISYKRFGSIKGDQYSPIKDKVSGARDKMKKIIKEKMVPLMCVGSPENAEDMAYAAPIVKKLSDTVLMFRKRLLELKTEANAYDFSDISAFALKLLIDRGEDGEIRQTDIAKELSGRFTEILVDEFQDINEAQDMLFRALSKDGKNLFMVGDVKQSIYGFRQAMPEVFLEKKSSMPRYTDGNYPGYITLGKNFRSRLGVTQAVNFIFNTVMSESVGGVNYRDGEELICGASYSEKEEADAEIHLLEVGEGEKKDKIRVEAEYIAQLIRKMISSGFTVKKGDKEVKASYKDFCVLIRSGKDRMAEITETLLKCGVPAYADTSGGFFGTPEISFMLSLLRVIDNPAQDVPLTAVMLSPSFGFTPDELAEIRLSGGKKTNFYSCVLSYSEKDEKCRRFVERIRGYRRVSAMLSAGELVRRLLSDTGYLAIAGAMKSGERRRANLLKFRELAVKYENAGYIGLSGFIRFIDKLGEAKEDVDSVSPLSDAADVVRVMTIHRSKGLEFPVCIVANCSGKFNLQDVNKNYVLSREYGIGIMRRDQNKFLKYTTLSKNAVSLMAARNLKSEEM